MDGSYFDDGGATMDGSYFDDGAYASEMDNDDDIENEAYPSSTEAGNDNDSDFEKENEAHQSSIGVSNDNDIDHEAYQSSTEVGSDNDIENEACQGSTKVGKDKDKIMEAAYRRDDTKFLRIFADSKSQLPLIRSTRPPRFSRFPRNPHTTYHRTKHPHPNPFIRVSNTPYPTTLRTTIPYTTQLRIFFIPCNSVQHTDPKASEPHTGFLYVLPSDKRWKATRLDFIWDHGIAHFDAATTLRDVLTSSVPYVYADNPCGARHIASLSHEHFEDFNRMGSGMDKPVTCRDTLANMWWRIAKAVGRGILPVSALRNLEAVFHNDFSTYVPEEAWLVRQRRRDEWEKRTEKPVPSMNGRYLSRFWQWEREYGMQSEQAAVKIEYLTKALGRMKDELKMREQLIKGGLKLREELKFMPRN